MILRAIVIVALGTWSARALLPPPQMTSARVCSLAPIPGFKLVGEAFFLGYAIKDTVFTGPGATVAGSGRGHYGGPTKRGIYGQYVRLTQIDGADIPADVRKADTVIVVPWDYDAACEPVPWGGSAAWLTSDELRFFYPKLRDRDGWVGSVPTFDAFLPGVDVFPSFRPDVPPIQSGVPPGRRELTASAESLFAFFQSIPALTDYREVPESAFIQLQEWAAAHPVLTRTSPIADVLGALAHRAAITRARHYLPPMLGTYRLTVSIPNSRKRTVYLRTADRTDPYTFHGRLGYYADTAAHPLEVTSLGVNVPFWTASKERHLPTSSRQGRRSQDAEQSSWGWHIAWPDSVRATGEWPADFDPFEFLSDWSETDPAVAAFSSAYEESYPDSWDDRHVTAWTGAFSGSSHTRFRQRVVVRDIGSMVVEATRVSSETVQLERE